MFSVNHFTCALVKLILLIVISIEGLKVRHITQGAYNSTHKEINMAREEANTTVFSKNGIHKDVTNVNGDVRQFEQGAVNLTEVNENKIKKEEAVSVLSNNGTYESVTEDGEVRQFIQGTNYKGDGKNEKIEGDDITVFIKDKKHESVAENEVKQLEQGEDELTSKDITVDNEDDKNVSPTDENDSMTEAPALIIFLKNYSKSIANSNNTEYHNYGSYRRDNRKRIKPKLVPPHNMMFSCGRVTSDDCRHMKVQGGIRSYREICNHYHCRRKRKKDVQEYAKFHFMSYENDYDSYDDDDNEGPIKVREGKQIANNSTTTEGCPWYNLHCSGAVHITRKEDQVTKKWKGSKPTTKKLKHKTKPRQ